MPRGGSSENENIVLVVVLVLGFLGKIQAELEDGHDDEDEFIGV